ncbi:MAG: imidazolonepropionase-like amidohydrolase [Planctomycetota bacterium]|jgi:imidazolonepropionase-like amidohydrolase
MLLGCLALSPPLVSAQSAPRRAQPYAITGVRLSLEEGAKPRTLILSDGRIEFVLNADAELPAGVRTIDGDGLYATPALIDAYSTAGCATPAPKIERDIPADTGANVRIDMREANRKGIQPAFAAARVLELDAEASKAYREKGFALYLSSPQGELLSGTSALASTRAAAARDQIVMGEVFDHAAFSANGSGYPSTLMGYMAQLRQFFYDTQRHGELQSRFRDGKPGAPPVFDEDLDAGLEVLSGERRLMCEADNARDIRRWIRLADEFNLKIAISGGREAFKVTDALASRGIPVVLTLDWGKEAEDPDKKKDEKKKKKGKDEDSEAEEAPDAEPESAALDAFEHAVKVVEAGSANQSEESEEVATDEKGDEEAELDWNYEEPIGVRREKRRLWEQKRDCAMALHKAGVRFAFGSGTGSAKDLRERVSTLVENGLAAEVAVAAMTTQPAEILGVASHFGRLESGYAANLALWTDAPTEKKAQLAWLVVDGFPHEFELKEESEASGEGPAEGVDLTGTWTVEVDSEEEDEPATFVLKMSDDGSVSGSMSFKSPMDGSAVKQDISGQVSGRAVELDAEFTMGGFEISLSFNGKLGEDGDSFSGERGVSGPGFEETDEFSASRAPGSLASRASLGSHLAELLAFGEAQQQRSGTGAEGGAPLGAPTGRTQVESKCGCDEIGQGHSGHDHDEEDDQ